MTVQRTEEYNENNYNEYNKDRYNKVDDFKTESHSIKYKSTEDWYTLCDVQELINCSITELTEGLNIPEDKLIKLNSIKNQVNKAWDEEKELFELKVIEKENGHELVIPIDTSINELPDIHIKSTENASELKQNINEKDNITVYSNKSFSNITLIKDNVHIKKSLGMNDFISMYCIDKNNIRFYSHQLLNMFLMLLCVICISIELSAFTTIEDPIRVYNIVVKYFLTGYLAVIIGFIASYFVDSYLSGDVKTFDVN